MDECMQEPLAQMHRCLRRHREREFLLGVKALRLELMLIREQARVRELEGVQQWARLEEISEG
jgi:hypothetical protein